MKKDKNPGAAEKIISVILGTLAGGFMWRCRGESGFGSSWGLYSVALILILIIYNFYGNKKGFKFEMIPIGAFLAGLGVTGYATVIEQLAGVIYNDVTPTGEVVYCPVDKFSGLYIILIMGFTLVPLFAFFVGSLFSEKEYKLYHYVIMAAIFFGVSYICKASVSHFILKAINPDQVNYAAEGLKAAGHDYSSPMMAYMKHFAGRKWSQTVPFFENYYMSVEHISDFIAVIAIALYPLIAFKDKLTCCVTLVINAFVSVATTALSSLISVCFRSGFFEGITVPRCLENGAGWGIWEYATGASVGFITMLVIALMPKKYTRQGNPDKKPLFESNKLNFIFNTVAGVFIFALVPWRAIGIRTGKLLENAGILEDSSPTGDIIMIAGAVIFGLWFIYLFKKNIIDSSVTPFNVTPFGFSAVALPAYLGLCCVLYFFTNHAYALHLPFSEMKDFSSFVYIMTGPQWLEFTVMFISAVIFTVFYIPTRKKLMKLNNNKIR